MPAPVALPHGTIDLVTGRGWVRGRAVRLSARECTLLEVLAEAGGGTVAREALEAAIGLPADAHRAVLDVAVSRLRAKIEPDPRHPVALISVFNTGYRLVTAEEGRPAPAQRPRTLLVGRADTLASLVATPGLATLTGPPGVGKTAIARHWAEHKGALFIDLSATRHPAELAAAVLAATGRSHALAGPADERVEQVVLAISSAAPGGLVLDHADANQEAVVALVDRLRLALPELGVLVTSTRPLDVDSERVVPLAPLSAADAVQLLRQRAAELGVERIDDPHLSDLAAALDRLPLALELAAARLRILSPEQLVERLEGAGRSRLLADGRGAGLWRALEATWVLLDPEAQRCLAWASVCVETLHDEAVAPLLGNEGPEAVERLTRWSLLQPTADGHRLLRSIRRFAQEKLDARGERAEAELRHARTYVALAAPRWSQQPRRHPAVLDALEPLMPELIATARVAPRDPGLVARVVHGLFPWFEIRGGLAALRRLTEAASPHLSATHPGRAGLLRAHGTCLRWLGDRRGALAAFDAALVAGPDAASVVHAERAVVLDGVARREACRQALASADALPVQERVRVLANAATLLGTCGASPAEVEARLRHALELAVATDDPWEAAATRGKLGGHLRRMGRLEEAEPLLVASLDLREQWEARVGAALFSLATLRVEQGRRDGLALLERSRAVFAAEGQSAPGPYLDLVQAAWLLRQGDAERALDLLVVPERGPVVPVWAARLVALIRAGRVSTARREARELLPRADDRLRDLLTAWLDGAPTASAAEPELPPPGHLGLWWRTIQAVLGEPTP